MTYGQKLTRRIALYGFLALTSGVAVAAITVLESHTPVYVKTNTSQDVTPFPISIDIDQATITTPVLLDDFYNQYVASNEMREQSILNRIAHQLQFYTAYQQLSSSVTRTIVVWPGERTAEAAKHIGDVLRWSQADRDAFIAYMNQNNLSFSEGFILPGKYTTHRYATPEDIAELLRGKYHAEVTNRYTDDIATEIPLSDTLIIASLIEREASDFVNMREVSGVIWNRLFIDMPLQLDASLQYARSEQAGEPQWWPAVRPADKFIDSPYNTYQHEGLPPGPITNPSVAAIVAALNPIPTDCLFYFHSATGEYYCSTTYKEHVQKLRQVY